MADNNNNNKIVNPGGLTNRTEEDNFGGIDDGDEIRPRPRPRPPLDDDFQSIPDGDGNTIPNDGHNRDRHHHHDHPQHSHDGIDEDEVATDPGGGDGDGGITECFVAGTKVKIPNGLEKNIEDIQIGEQVLSYNIHTKKLELKKVTELFTQVHDLVNGDITAKTKFSNGIETHNTIANPFWSKDKGFVAADAERCNRLHQWVKQTNKGKDTEQLEVGDTLYHYNGEELQEVIVTEIEHILEPYIRTYDITVEDNHTFFANGILTHNSAGDDSETERTEIGKCCMPGTQQDGASNGANTNAEACNQIDCSLNDSPDFIYVHHDWECVGPMGLYGEYGHNVVFEYYNEVSKRASDEEFSMPLRYGQAPNQEDPNLQFYPHYNKGNDFRLYYLRPVLGYDVDKRKYFDPPKNAFNKEQWTEQIFNPNIYDKYQRGVNREGTELYNLPIYDEITCDDVRELSPNHDGTASDDDTAATHGLLNSPPSVFYNFGEGFTTHNLNSSKVRGIFPCGITHDDNFPDTLLLNQAVNIFSNTQDGLNYIALFFAQYDFETITKFEGEPSTDFPSIDLGFGLSWLTEDDYTGNILYDLLNPESGDYDTSDNRARDFLIRLGFPLPPVAIFGEINPMCGPDDDGVTVKEHYLTLVNEWYTFIQAKSFFSDFYIPDVEINPTMNKTLDVLSGMDLRPAKLDACQYIEFMTLPGGSSDGDGIYYKGSDLPDEYFDYNSNANNEQYIKNFACDTEWDRNLRFSRLRATCKDGSTIMVGTTGDNNNTTIQVTNNDKKFDNGIQACNSTLRLQQSHELYYLADGDERESLGVFFFDNENKKDENYLNSKDEQFNQYILQNFLNNGNGTSQFESYSAVGFTNPFGASEWSMLNKNNNNQQPTDNQMRPYWSDNNLDCFSYDRCLIVDTMSPFESDNMNFAEEQGIVNKIRKAEFNSRATRPKQQYKVSFMMKTKRLYDGVNLENTGIHLINEFGLKNYTVPQKRNFYSYENDVNGLRINNYRNSQCSPGSHPRGLKGNHYSLGVNDSLNHLLTYEDSKGILKRTYCEESRASFTNTKLNEWQKMEFIFETDPLTADNFGGTAPTYFKTFILPLQFVNSFDIMKIGEGSILYNDINDDDEVLANFLNGAAEILLDNFEVKESYDFHPDVDVRKRRGANDYGLVSLTEYYDPNKEDFNIEEYNDTVAPLEAQFYFYPRFSYDDTLSGLREPLVEPFKFGQYYIGDIDWGDGSSVEFSDKFEKLGVNKMINHTYENSGIYEINATMIRTIAEEYDWSSVPELIYYDGNLGTAHNKKFKVVININDAGLNEDFRFFGSDGFSFIPYRNTLPIIGGISKQSTYYKTIKRNLGILKDDLINVNYDNQSERLKTEFAFAKMDSTFNDNLKTLPIYQQPVVNAVDVSDDYLASLPFPHYLQEFDIESDGLITEDIEIEYWNSIGRPDVVSAIENYAINTDQNLLELVGVNFKDNWMNHSAFINPTNEIFSKQYTGKQYSDLEEEFGNSLGDLNIQNVKYYDKPKNIVELFGFTERLPNNLTEEATGILGIAGFNVTQEGDNIQYLIGSENPSVPGSEDFSPVDEYTQEVTAEEYFNGQNQIHELYDWTEGHSQDILPNQVICSILFEGNPEDYTPISTDSPEGTYTITGAGEDMVYNTYTCEFGTEGVYFKNHPATINSQKYWKNIIPKNYSIYNREGINLDNVNVGGSITIDTYSEQEWLDDYYYPVLPRYSQDGKFISQGSGSFNDEGIFTEDVYPNDNKPFPLEGPITDENETNKNLILSLSSETIEPNIFDDNSGKNNKGCAISDFKPKFNNQTFKVNKTKSFNILRTNKKNRAF